MNKNRNNSPSNHTSGLKVVTLSGTDEVGRNCNFIEFNNQIIIIDCGFSFPEQELYGVDYLIPNFHYLKKNKNKIKGILITHGHMDHTGALPYVLPEIGFPPIYGGDFALGLIRERLAEFKLDQKTKLISVHRQSTINVGSFKINFIGVTHSIPNAFAIFVETPAGNVFFSGDYKIDPAPANEMRTDFGRLRGFRGRVDLALMESTNSAREGRATSEGEVSKTLENIIRKAKGRVVIAAFSSQISRLYLTMEAAAKLNRKVFLSGRSLRKAYQIARELKYIKTPQDLVVSDKLLKNYPDNKVLFLTTGSQGERYGALNRIATGEHKFFKVKKGDTVVLSSSEIPGNEYQIGKMTDELIRKGADIINSKSETVHASGHGLTEDMKIMYDLIQPKNVIPIHGTLTMRYTNKANFVGWGHNPEKIFLTEDGQGWKVRGSNVVKDKRIPSKPILIDGLGVGDIGDVVIKDRQQLAEFGMVVVIINLSSQSKNIIGRIKFVSRGFVYVKTSQDLFNRLEKIVQEQHADWKQASKEQKKYSYEALKETITKAIASEVYKSTKREPMVMPVIV